MVCSLRSAMKNIMGEDKSYLHYYKRIINDFENGNWNFDIRTLVKKMYIDVPCSKYLARKGYRKHFCLGIIDFEKFKTEYEKYLNGYLYPWQKIRKNKIIARKAWIKKYGYITKGNQYCQNSMYDCSKCLNSTACEIAKKHTGNEPAMMEMTKMLELLYGNLQAGHYASFVS